MNEIQQQISHTKNGRGRRNFRKKEERRELKRLKDRVSGGWQVLCRAEIRKKSQRVQVKSGCVVFVQVRSLAT